MYECIELLLVVWTSIVAVSSNHCREPQFDPYERFASRTHSNVVSNMDDNPVNFPGCEAKQIWMLLRHGARYPNIDLIEKMVAILPTLHEQILENIQSGTTTLCQDDAEALRRWHLRYDVTISAELMESGAEEMRKIAGRYKTRFPDLLGEEFTNETYLLKHTATQRTEYSANAFSEGLFGEVVYMPEAEKNDPVIRFYKRCQSWMTNIYKNNETLREQSLYRQGAVMKQVLVDVSRRLGFNNTLDYDKIQVMYEMCRTEKAERYVLLSSWCVVFNEDEFKILEYHEDLAYYWRDSYGAALNYESACPLLKDWMQSFRAVVDGSSSRRGVFYFSHDGAIVKFLTAMGLFNDSYTLRHDNYNQHRRFQSSDVIPFSSNIALVLLDCNGTHKVMTYVQEKPETTQAVLWRDVEVKFGRTADKCNFQAICAGAASLSSQITVIIGLLLLGVFTRP